MATRKKTHTTTGARKLNPPDSPGENADRNTGGNTDRKELPSPHVSTVRFRRARQLDSIAERIAALTDRAITMIEARMIDTHEMPVYAVIDELARSAASLKSLISSLSSAADASMRATDELPTARGALNVRGSIGGQVRVVHLPAQQYTPELFGSARIVELPEAYQMEQDRETA